MIHPYFETVPDKYVAEVFSEWVVRQDFTHNSEVIESFGREAGFPPEPSYLTSVTAAFLAPDDTSVRWSGVYGVSGRDVDPSDAELLQSYRDNVLRHKAPVPTMEEMATALDIAEAHPQYGRLGQWCIDLAHREGVRLLGAHLVFRADRSNRLYSSLTYHRAIKEQFPLLVRQALQPLVLLQDTAEADIAGQGGLPPAVQKFLASARRNDESFQTLAGVPPSALMPSLTQVKAGLREYHRMRGH